MVADPDAPRPWPIEGSRVEHEYSIFTIRRDRARSPRTGLLHDFIVVEPSDAVAVVALTPGRELVLVEQFRFGTRANTLELPGGVLHGDDALAAAERELREETGYRGSGLALLGTLDVNPSWHSQKIHLVLATDAVLAGPREEDDAEDIRVRLVPLADVPRLVASGVIHNAIALAGVYLLDNREP
jgi:ADP-ribose pyrophosphatase